MNTYAGMTNNLTIDDVLTNFELFLMKQFGANCIDVTNSLIHSKVDVLLNDDLNYWSFCPVWTLYDSAKQQLINEGKLS